MGTLQEELIRYNAINKYTEKLISEQEPPLPAGAAGAAGAPPAPGGEPPLPPPPGGEAGAPPPGGEADAETPAPGGEDQAGTPEKPEVSKDTEADDNTEELDITDLVNMTKSIKKQLDDTKGQDTGATQKMDDVFSKLGELESKLGEMDQVLAKIDQLGAEIEKVKPKTPVEKLEMRSLDSYPFNQKPDEFFKGKQDEMRKSGKNEYVLTKNDVENYGKYDVMKSFNPSTDADTTGY
jgi:hypothetical protein